LIKYPTQLLVNDFKIKKNKPKTMKKRSITMLLIMIGFVITTFASVPCKAPPKQERVCITNLIQQNELKSDLTFVMNNNQDVTQVAVSAESERVSQNVLFVSLAENQSNQINIRQLDYGLAERQIQNTDINTKMPENSKQTIKQTLNGPSGGLAY